MTETRIKICGITNLADAACAAEAGADLLGYIIYPPSKRFVRAETVQKIVYEIMQEFPQVQHVAVTVNESLNDLVQMRNVTGVSMLQLHGQESPETVTALRQDGITVIKAIPVHGEEMILDPTEFEADYLLFDTHSPATHGGSGKQFNLAALSKSISLTHAFIAGGLTPENVAAVLNTASPYAVDVASGVEKSPGKKDQSLVNAFIQAVRRTKNRA